MLHPVDVRFKADSRQIVQASQVHFPLRVCAQRSTTVQALADARRVLDQLRGAAADAEFADGRLTVPDPDADDGRGAAELIIEQKSPREVRVQIALTVSLTLDGTGAFWAHASAIAAAADFLQGFAQRPHDKGIEVDVAQARLVNKGAGASERSPGATA